MLLNVISLILARSSQRFAVSVTAGIAPKDLWQLDWFVAVTVIILSLNGYYVERRKSQKKKKRETLLTNDNPYMATPNFTAH